ncbi:hypothetical protein GCM10007170_01620 [Arthrobacter liuii]|uniref:Uncharacterized protein n=1 Tax=Arthrobacter liuii TaxID=1476996 RepID=A0ABQ2AFZ1_9MICC|nr:hypothetical protein GCM10007170_01620 [Arthrobacter liuii]
MASAASRAFTAASKRFKPRHELQPFQPDPIPPLQHIHTGANIDPGSQSSVLKVQRIKGSNAGVSTFRCYPDTPADSHRRIIQRGTDIEVWSIRRRPLSGNLAPWTATT